MDVRHSARPPQQYKQHLNHQKKSVNISTTESNNPKSNTSFEQYTMGSLKSKKTSETSFQSNIFCELPQARITSQSIQDYQLRFQPFKFIAQKPLLECKTYTKRLISQWTKRQTMKNEIKANDEKKENDENKENLQENIQINQHRTSTSFQTIKNIKKTFSSKQGLDEEFDFRGKIGKLKFPQPKLSAKSWAIFEVNSCKLIWGQKCHNQREVASLTKIMTFMTAIKLSRHLDLNYDNTYFRVSRTAANLNGTSAQLIEGSYISLSDLFYGLMLPSGNDAAWVIAESIGALSYLYSQYDTQGEVFTMINEPQKKCELNALIESVSRPVNNFIYEMNRHSRELSITNSTWNSPHGMNNKYNKSSSYDIGRLTCKAMLNIFFRKVVKTKEYTATQLKLNGEKIRITWYNTNKLLDEGWEGVKTGVTPNAGPCLSACVQQKIQGFGQPLKIVIVVLNCQTMEHRWDECKQLAQWIFKNEDI